MTYAASIIVLCLLSILSVANAIMLAYLARAVAETRRITESARGAASSVEAMARNIVAACDEMRREVAEMHRDVLQIGLRLHEIEDREDEISVAPVIPIV